MATRLPRLAVTLPAETHRTLQALSVLQRKPKSAIAAELLEEMTPALAKVAELLATAQRNRASLPTDTAAKLQAVEDLLAHTAAFGMERMTQAVQAPAQARAAKRGAARARPGRKH